MHRMHLFVVAFAAAAASGCASDPIPEPRVASAPVMATDANPGPFMAPPAQPLDTASPTSGSVHIDARIRAACGDLPAARFAFDSARVDPYARAALDALARCFSQGPLRGHGMRLIGHADPRGEMEYNLALGHKRAGSVADYMAERGVDRRLVATSSRGELEASGTDEEGWARDRKVDVLLAD
jgi:peptidoglycan-associated lipoprotein